MVKISQVGDNRQYEAIPREAWWLVHIQMVPDLGSLWRAKLEVPEEVDPERVAKLLAYDSIVLAAREVEKLWPKTSREYDRDRKRLLNQAGRAGANEEHIKFLREGHMATPDEGPLSGMRCQKSR